MPRSRPASSPLSFQRRLGTAQGETACVAEHNAAGPLAAKEEVIEMGICDDLKRQGYEFDMRTAAPRTGWRSG